ncbi:hypothetical protein FAF44_46025 [Nonomuraea sp. MG754425]|uniref:hypothetical protein n=1 Tax=Nonomuraea sp. MG754425 TaxID=2570319 RepID=UPI001F2F36DF|nr:hypothetical protein [Nonomuraea sp. MG754425]MCF6475661.1 hypothetical protein [Nonomuraea sp. MG754425]
MRAIAAAAVAVVTLAVSGCTASGFDQANTVPQNDGANADVGQTLHLRNVFLLGSADPTSPAPQQALFGVLVNSGPQPDQLERVSPEGGGSVQLTGQALLLPPDQAVGTGEQPIGMASGVRGESVPMTFAFRDGRSVRMLVPVMARIGHFANLPTTPASPGSTLSPAALSPATATAGPSPTG